MQLHIALQLITIRCVRDHALDQIERDRESTHRPSLQTVAGNLDRPDGLDRNRERSHYR